jgi:hypothetical protein
MSALFNFFANYQNAIGDIFFLVMSFSVVYYTVNTLFFELSSLVSSFNERQKKGLLSKAESDELDAMLARYGVIITALIIRWF